MNATPTVSRDFNFDVEADGLPGAWEIDHGLSPVTQDNNGDFDTDGYTASLSNAGVLSFAPIPEPASFAVLAGLGALGLSATRRRRRA